MGKYVEVQIGDKGTILVDVTPAEGIFQAGGESLIEKMEDAFEDAISTIQTCAEGFVSRIAAFSKDNRPQEVSLEFGLGFEAEVGVVVTKMSGDANFKVSLTWKEDGIE